MTLIKSQNLYIDKFTLDLAESVHLYSLDEDNRTFLPEEVFETIDEAKEVITKLISYYGQKDKPKVFPVFLNNSQHIGHIQAVPINVKDKCRERCPHSSDWEIGYHIAKQNTNNGYATEALKAFLNPIIQYLEIHQIYGICRADNPASSRVLEKCGFVLTFDGIGDYHGSKHYILRYIHVSVFHINHCFSCLTH
ncbi:MAG: GNAT family N-acetyltransferase [Candidatus Cloacimonetes bacterium]|nr:GNAT family N-acetyltransferase [Candidatus Cloacimonadota bacterium]